MAETGIPEYPAMNNPKEKGMKDLAIFLTGMAVGVFMTRKTMEIEALKKALEMERTRTQS